MAAHDKLQRTMFNQNLVGKLFDSYVLLPSV